MAFIFNEERTVPRTSARLCRPLGEVRLWEEGGRGCPRAASFLRKCPRDSTFPNLVYLLPDALVGLKADAIEVRTKMSL